VVRLAGGDVPSSADDSPATAGMKPLLKRLGRVLKTPEFAALRKKLDAKEISPDEFRQSLAKLAEMSG